MHDLRILQAASLPPAGQTRTVFPMMVNLRLTWPSTPEVTRPVCTPTRRRTGCPLCGKKQWLEASKMASANTSIAAAFSVAVSTTAAESAGLVKGSWRLLERFRPEAAMKQSPIKSSL